MSTRFKRPAFWTDTLDLVVLVILAFALAFLTKAYFVQPYIVDGQSMETTLQNHDRLLVNKLPETIGKLRHHPYTPARGDIIVFNQSGLPGFSGSKQLIKRVVGVPGDHVVIKSGELRIYNAAHPKGFNPDTTGKYQLSTDYTLGDVDLTLQSGQLFVCGDNRNNSEDSRYFGPINQSQIVGRLSLRIYPFSKFQHY